MSRGKIIGSAYICWSPDNRPQQILRAVHLIQCVTVNYHTRRGKHHVKSRETWCHSTTNERAEGLIGRSWYSLGYSQGERRWSHGTKRRTNPTKVTQTSCCESAGWHVQNVYRLTCELK